MMTRGYTPELHVTCPRCHGRTKTLFAMKDCLLCAGTKQVPQPMAVEYGLLGGNGRREQGLLVEAMSEEEILKLRTQYKLPARRRRMKRR